MYLNNPCFLYKIVRGIVSCELIEMDCIGIVAHFLLMSNDVTTQRPFDMVIWKACRTYTREATLQKSWALTSDRGGRYNEDCT